MLAYRAFTNTQISQIDIQFGQFSGSLGAYMSMTDDFFRNRLDLHHPLAVLANRMPWQEIDASLAHRFARQVRTGKKIEDTDMFGPTVAVAGAGVSNAGRPR
jgi:IS5 family transposase